MKVITCLEMDLFIIAHKTLNEPEILNFQIFTSVFFPVYFTNIFAC